ncbi:hypothetical protein BJY00DRAFT_317005 [Aspergillus carlsbadensis]|nr:hypothetical protein BJY00DRAFT_317005 [Aspergillus carlsbadensis]
MCPTPTESLHHRIHGGQRCSEAGMPGKSSTRRRTGCLTCRRRRVRCDEAKPTCHNCHKGNRNCTWYSALRFVHHSGGPADHGLAGGSEEIDHASPEPSRTDPVLVPAEESPDQHIDNPPPAQSTTAPVAGQQPGDERASHDYTGYTNRQTGTTALGLHTPLGSNSVPSPSENQTAIDYSEPHVTPYPPTGGESLTPGQGSAVTFASASAGHTAITFATAHDNSGGQYWSPEHLFGDGVPSDTQTAALSDYRFLELLQNYIHECASWFDITDRQRHFSHEYLQRMMHCIPWRTAVLALSAKNLELRFPGTQWGGPSSLELYQVAVRHAIAFLAQDPRDAGGLAGCLILAVYEMMTFTLKDWTRHLQGCASILTSNNWNSSSEGLAGRCFWGFTRIDIWAAYCSKSRTIIDPQTWFDAPDTVMQREDMDEETHAHVAQWLAARVVNIISGERKYDHPTVQEEIRFLRAAFSAWEAKGCAKTQPLLFQDPSGVDDEPFPIILLQNSSSVIGHSMFHTGLVLLLQYEAAHGSPNWPHTAEEIYQHSRQARECLVNSVQPMWVCGQHLRTRSEKFGVLEIFGAIERETGWKSSGRSSELRSLWKIP